MPVIMYLGLTIGELRKMSKRGRISSDRGFGKEMKYEKAFASSTAEMLGMTAVIVRLSVPKSQVKYMGFPALAYRPKRGKSLPIRHIDNVWVNTSPYGRPKWSRFKTIKSALQNAKKRGIRT